MLLPTLLLGRCISTHTSIHWRPPPENNIKLSFHDSVVSSSQSACAFVIRDCKIGAANILIAGQALLDGLNAALSLGVSSLEVEGDSKINLIDAINGTWSTSLVSHYFGVHVQYSKDLQL
ncbi:unnamed protein product [Malus baccata var. baccata]